MRFRRYAIFYTPAPGPLADFCAAWLGWDPVAGRRVAHPSIDGLPVSEVTEAARKYGFHGTIKPPFSLVDDESEAALKTAFTGFCNRAVPVVTDHLEIARLGRFLALVPVQPSDALKVLAGNAVRALDRFRAPAGQAEMARRRTSPLSDAQEAMLLQWGYPYVMDEFRFHMTLTGKLPGAQGGQVKDLLTPLIAPLCPAPLEIDALSLMGEDEAGMFHLIARQAMAG